MLEKKKAAEQLRQEAERVSLQAVIDTIDKEENAAVYQHEREGINSGISSPHQEPVDSGVTYSLGHGDRIEGPPNYGVPHCSKEGSGARSRQSSLDQPGSSEMPPSLRRVPRERDTANTTKNGMEENVDSILEGIIRGNNNVSHEQGQVSFAPDGLPDGHRMPRSHQ